MSKALQLQDIPTGREGWVYLIHAVGTRRYKIGRSVNPLARLETLKGQSPYPLQVIWTRWTFDAVEDERRAHQALAEYRVYGEWFEFDEVGADGKRYTGSLARAEEYLTFSGVINDLRHEGLDTCSAILGIDPKTDSPEGVMEVYDLYDMASSVSEINKIRHFLLIQLPIICDQYWQQLEGVEGKELIEKQNSFIAGAVISFALTSLGKKRWHQ